MNSIRQDIETTTGNTDKIMISETMLDKSFPKVQFLIKELIEPYRLDCNSKCGGIKLFIGEDVPSKLLSIGKKFS